MWADLIVDAIQKRFADEISSGTELVIRDEKTLSGRVHVGSLRGIVIHGLIAQVLNEKGVANTFKFELNDFDPMDELPVYIDQKKYKKHTGEPLFMVPAHTSAAPNYPMVFGMELKDVVKKLGLPIAYYTLRPLYEEGKFNEVIHSALDHAADIRTIYREVSGSKKPDDWYPLNVICEQCKKVGTTQVTRWDSLEKTVHYTCKKDLVTWAQGCGHEGKTSPFNGNAKLPWKVEWPAKWKVLGVHIEGAGKDHSAAGGSRDIGRRISQEIFNYPEPFDIPYEFFNIQGKKMSASKGIGSSSKDIADLLPPHLLKLLMIRKQPNLPIDFDPEGRTIPNLFDEFDRLAEHYFKRCPEPDADFARIFLLAHIDPTIPQKDLWHMRFSTMIFILQMPHLDLEEEAEKLKGSPLTDDEQEALHERAQYVQKWLESYAPADMRYTILKEVPANLALDDAQKQALQKVQSALANDSLRWEGAPIHETIHAVKKEIGIEPARLFQPLYQLFLGRTNGPQIGWFLSTFEREDVLRRLGAVTMEP